MAKSELKPGVKMSRQEKKIFHRKNPTLVLPKGRRKYQSIAFKCKDLIRTMKLDEREVDWTAIVNVPPLVAPSEGSVYRESGGANE